MAAKAEQAGGAGMSDRMTNVEIEDVLSSIRRLVSEDGRAPPRARLAPTPDKLVLTPALRIVPEAAVSHQPDPVTTEPATAEPAPAAPEPPLHGLIAEESFTAFDALSHRAAAAALEAALSHRPDDWEPDGSEVTPQGAETWTVEWEADAADAEPAFVSTRHPAAAVAQTHVQPAPVADPATHNSMAELDGYMDWADSPAAPDTDLHIEDELPSVDEETLRDLIRDILREELQGPLGERITRNVRKLVRSEIARVLATRDFD